MSSQQMPGTREWMSFGGIPAAAVALTGRCRSRAGRQGTRRVGALPSRALRREQDLGPALRHNGYDNERDEEKTTKTKVTI
jgi:hypothetical protein